MVLQQVEAERHRKYQTSPSQASETRFGAATSLIWPDLVLRLVLVPWYQATNWYQVTHCAIHVPGSTKTQFWRYQLCLRCHFRNLAHALLRSMFLRCCGGLEPSPGISVPEIPMLILSPTPSRPPPQVSSIDRFGPKPNELATGHGTVVEEQQPARGTRARPGVPLQPSPKGSLPRRLVAQLGVASNEPWVLGVSLAVAMERTLP